ncbi:MAG: adenosyl-hopene transferase HpnH [Chloroflexota bacterium]
MSTRPLSLSIKMATYLLKQRVKKVDKFAITLFIEPLELCNLECEGCGRIREYADVMHMKLSVADCLRVANEVDAPIVTIPGGEPLIHPEIELIVDGLVAQGRFVYMCTNGLLLEKKLPKFKATEQFCIVVHMDGMKEQHDKAVCRPGVFDKAVKAMRSAIDQGFRVCTNTTIYKETDPADTAELFQFLTDDIGVEGCIVAPGYDYEAAEIGFAPGRTMEDVFLPREEAQKVFRDVRKRSGEKVRFYNNPLYLEFLEGKRQYQCAAWTSPTYTVRGWRSPCYLLADKHVGSWQELLGDTKWDAYGFGRDPRCANCMMHCGYESATLLEAFKHPRDLLKLASVAA